MLNVAASFESLPRGSIILRGSDWCRELMGISWRQGKMGPTTMVCSPLAAISFGLGVLVKKLDDFRTNLSPDRPLSHRSNPDRSLSRILFLVNSASLLLWNIEEIFFTLATLNWFLLVCTTKRNFHIRFPTTFKFHSRQVVKQSYKTFVHSATARRNFWNLFAFISLERRGSLTSRLV